MIALPLITDGKPLRFLAIVLGAWTGARFALVWLPATDSPPAISPTPPSQSTHPAQSRMSAQEHTSTPVRLEPSREAQAQRLKPFLDYARNEGGLSDTPREEPRPPAYSAEPAPPQIAEIFGDPRLTPPAKPTPSRWSGSAWALLRGSGGETSVATPQLGGGQIGARVAYRLDANGRLAAVARAAAAIGSRQQEAAIGVEWKPGALPLRFVAERRIGIANIRGGFAVGAIGGVDQIPLAAGFRLDGYAQGGVIARDGGVGYIDGALRAGRRVTPAIDLGIGAWGAAQPGASRIDIGPSAVVRLPVAGVGLRVGAEWRQRVAGDARPASGPAIALGMDF